MIQDLKDGLFASPFYILMSQLPISGKTVRVSRFLIFLIYNVSFNSFLISGIYILSAELRELIPLSHFPALLISFLALGIAIGGIIPAGEPGYRYRNKLHPYLFSGIFNGLGIAFIIGAQFVLPQGIIGWLVQLISAYPIITASVLILAAIFASLLWMKEMKRYIQMADYHI